MHTENSYLTKMKHKIPRLLPSSLFDREKSFLGKQQLYVYVYYSAVIVLALTANLIGVSGPQKSINLIINSVYVFVIILFFIGYLYRRINLSTALFDIIMVHRFPICWKQ